MTYFNEVRCRNGCVLSIDKLVLDLDFSVGYISATKQTYDEYFLMYLQFQKSFEYSRWYSQKIGTYEMNFSIKTSDDNSFWFGLGFNSSSGKEGKRARLEFNPNKVAFHPVFINFFNKLLGLCERPKIKRFDLAIDYPVERKNAYLIKDRRKYSEMRNSYDDRTQYLGTHNNHGFVKLYNKALESKLSIPLTRLELTLDYAHSHFTDLQLIFPIVRYFDNVQLKFDNFENNENVKITDTDRYILCTALENPEMLGMLGRYQRKKIESILDGYVQNLTIDLKDYNSLINKMDFYFNKIIIPKEFLNAHGEVSERYCPDWLNRSMFTESEVMYE